MDLLLQMHLLKRGINDLPQLLSVIIKPLQGSDIFQELSHAHPRIPHGFLWKISDESPVIPPHITDLFSIKQNTAAIPLQIAGQYLYQGGFSCPVFPQQTKQSVIQF